MKEDNILFIFAIIALIAYSFFGSMFVCIKCRAQGEMNLVQEAIERDYALYCPTTGEWAWKGECEEGNP